MKGSTLCKQDQLIVLGNGLDLQCGLKSSFSDFMKSRGSLIGEAASERDLDFAPLRKKPEDSNGEMSDEDDLAFLLRGIGLTAWDYVLNKDEQERTWYDVQECIRTWASYRSDGKTIPWRNTCSIYASYKTCIVPAS